MIKDSDSPVARMLFNTWLDRLLKKNYDAFFLVNNVLLQEHSKLIITPNHFSWWDGFFVDYATRKILKKETRIMMLEEQLKHYWFFSKVGAFSINPANPKSVITTAQYVNQIINGSDRPIVIYPQGKIEAYGKLPTLKEGLKFFISKISSDVQVMPAAFKISYNEKRLPSIYCRFGQTVSSEVVNEKFELYKEIFIDNLKKLEVASYKEDFNKDLFKETV